MKHRDHQFAGERESKRSFHRTINLGMLALVIALTAIVSTGCRWDHNSTDIGTPYGKLAYSLDQAHKTIEEFGTATVSSPLLSLPRKDDFPSIFNLNRPTTQFFEEAKTEVQGRSALLDQVINSMGIGISAQFDQVAAAAYAAELARYQEELSRFRAARAAADQAQAEQYALDQRVLEDQLKADLEVAKEKTTDAEKRAAEAEAYKKYADGRRALLPTAPTTAPAFPTTQSTSATFPTLATRPTEQLAVLASENGKFFGPQKLFVSSTTRPTVSNRTALITAAGDSATQAIFNVLGKPELLSQFADRTVLMGVVMVSVNPGWRTRKGFAVDIATRVEFDYDEASLKLVTSFINDPQYSKAIRKRVADDYQLTLSDSDLLGASAIDFGSDLPRFLMPVENTPLVSAISPMTETEAIDLESSTRRQEEFALKLALALHGAGYGAQGDAFENFVKNRQLDVNTRTPRVAVNAYSHAGGLFGYQIGPRLTAIENPGDVNSGAADVLDRQSFPSLVLFGLKQDDLRLRLRWDKGKLIVLEPSLKLSTTVSWLPVKKDWWRLEPIRLPQQELLGHTQDLRAREYAFDEAEKSKIMASQRDLADRAIDILKKGRKMELTQEEIDALHRYADAMAHDLAGTEYDADEPAIRELANKLRAPASDASPPADPPQDQKKKEQEKTAPRQDAYGQIATKEPEKHTIVIGREPQTKPSGDVKAAEKAREKQRTEIQSAFDAIRKPDKVSSRTRAAFFDVKNRSWPIDDLYSTSGIGELLKRKIAAAKYKLFGGGSSTSLPAELISAASFSTGKSEKAEAGKIPRIIDVSPDTLAAIEERPQVVVFSGENLGKLTKNNVKVEPEGLVSFDMKKSAEGLLAIAVTLKRAQPAGAITPLKFSFKDEKAQPLAPPLVVLLRSDPPRDKTITLTGPEGNRTITVSPGWDNDTLLKFLEQGKEKKPEKPVETPKANEAKVELKVEAKEVKDAKK